MPNWIDGRRRGATSGPQRFRVSLRHSGNFLASQPLASAEVAFVVDPPLESDLKSGAVTDKSTGLHQSLSIGGVSAGKLEDKSKKDGSSGNDASTKANSHSSSNDRSSDYDINNSSRDNPSKSNSCRAAVCVSGQWRTFANPRVRALFRENLLGGLSGQKWSQHKSSRSSRNSSTSSTGDDKEMEDLIGSEGALNHCDLDLFFYAKTTDAVSDRNYFFSRTTSLPSSETAMRQVFAQEFPETVAADARSRGGRGGGRIQIVHGDPPMPLPVPHNNSKSNIGSHSFQDRDSDHDSSSSGDDDSTYPSSPSWVQAHAKVAWPALHSVRACYDMVQEAEREEQRKRMHTEAKAQEAKVSSVKYQRTFTGAPAVLAGASTTDEASITTAPSKLWQYDWVVRTRFDLAYLLPLPPLPAFNLHRHSQDIDGSSSYKL